MSTSHFFAIEEAILGGPWERSAIEARLRTILKPIGRATWVKPITRRVWITYGTSVLPPRRHLLHRLLVQDYWIRFKLARLQDDLDQIEPDQLSLPDSLLLPPAVMTPDPRLPPLDIPALPTGGQLAAWLDLTPGEMDWFADQFGQERQRPAGPLRHYRYLWRTKNSGGLRLLESPKPRLKTIQRAILDGILSHIPPHAAAHAYRSGRSVRTAVAPHAGQRVVLHVDLREFFPSITAARVFAVYRTVGFPERVARLLTGLCTNSVPHDVLRTLYPLNAASRATERLHSRPHLPQGAPTSPTLANLCAYRLDVRLAALAQRTGAVYTRYADDLVFSGGRELLRMLPRFRVLVCAIAIGEGFEIRRRKTRVMVRGGRQQLAGIVVNSHPNIPRSEFDALKALLFNCIRFGPGSQNRDEHPHFREHLRGRIAWWVQVNPVRAKKLSLLFDRIVWDEPSAGK